MYQKFQVPCLCGSYVQLEIVPDYGRGALAAYNTLSQGWQAISDTCARDTCARIVRPSQVVNHPDNGWDHNHTNGCLNPSNVATYFFQVQTQEEREFNKEERKPCQQP